MMALAMNQSYDPFYGAMPPPLGYVEPEKFVGNLNDFIHNDGFGYELHVEVAVKDDGQIAVFHNKPFVNTLAWLEFDLTTNRLEFMREDGEVRDFGFAIPKSMSKNMQNTHQVLMVLMDEESGQPIEDKYLPLIIHRKEFP